LTQITLKQQTILFQRLEHTPLQSVSRSKGGKKIGVENDIIFSYTDPCHNTSYHFFGITTL
jgi:hypothetical protein